MRIYVVIWWYNKHTILTDVLNLAATNTRGSLLRAREGEINSIQQHQMLCHKFTRELRKERSKGEENRPRRHPLLSLILLLFVWYYLRVHFSVSFVLAQCWVCLLAILFLSLSHPHCSLRLTHFTLYSLSNQ